MVQAHIINHAPLQYAKCPVLQQERLLLQKVQLELERSSKSFSQKTLLDLGAVKDPPKGRATDFSLHRLRGRVWEY